MSSRAIPSGLPALRAALDRDGQHPDQGPVVGRPGHRVDVRRFQQLIRLSQDAALGGAEHEVQRDGRDGPGEQRHEHHLPANELELTEDGRRVSPDADDRDDLAVHLDREVGPQDVVRGQGRADRLGIGDRVEPGRDRPARGGREIGRRRPVRAHHSVGVGQQDGPVRETHLDPQDLSRGDDRPDLCLDRGGAGSREAAQSEIRRCEIGVRERPHRGRIRADDRGQHRLRRLRRHDDRLTQRRHADDHQEEAEDDDQEDRPPERPKWRSEQADFQGWAQNVPAASTSVLYPKVRTRGHTLRSRPTDDGSTG